MCGTNKSDAKAVLSTIDEVSSNVGVKLHWNRHGKYFSQPWYKQLNFEKNLEKVLEKNKSVYVNGLPCHIVHNTVKEDKSNFTLKVYFNIENMLVDVFHWVDKCNSTKLIEHIPTCCLSLESAVTRCKNCIIH